MNTEHQQYIDEVQGDIDSLRSKGVPVGNLTDGYHSFNQLYAHRIALFISLAKQMARYKLLTPVWISKTQSDGTAVQDGWFILGVHKKQGKQMTYHIPMSRWDECTKFAEQLTNAPTFDGHTSDDVLKRIAEL